MVIQTKVSVCMITYNHEKFIRESINGVLMRECDFEIELVVANDCSLDETNKIVNDIIKTHPRASWIKYINHKENIGMTPNFIGTLSECKGEYIALCEGDDYWTDPLKLQKQVDFLEANTTISGCFHHAKLVDHNGITLKQIYNPHVGELYKYTQVDCLTKLKSAYATCTLLFRRTAYKNVSEAIQLQMCDELLDLVITENGDLCFLNFNGSSYRVHEGGIWNSRSRIVYQVTMYLRKKALYDTPNFRKKYGLYLKIELLYIAKTFLYSNAITKKQRLYYFFNTLNYLNFIKKESYVFVVNFIYTFSGFKKFLN